MILIGEVGKKTKYLWIFRLAIMLTKKDNVETQITTDWRVYIVMIILSTILITIAVPDNWECL